MNSIAHKHDMNHIGRDMWPDGTVPWDEARPPQKRPGSMMMTGELRNCGYCGSMHPADVAAAILAGAKGSWADRKYGWPHKAYFDKIPNPHAGLLEVRCGGTHKSDMTPVEHIETRYNEITGASYKHKTYTEHPRPAPATTYGKFYSVHLQDATPEERDIIEKHLGLKFTFQDGKVSWAPYA